MVSEVVDLLKANKPNLMPMHIWEVYARLHSVTGKPTSELTALVSLLRLFSGRDETLTPYANSVNKNFQEWVFGKHAGTPKKFTEAQISWLQMIRDHVATSLRCEMDDLDFAPFDKQGGLGKMHELFGDEMQFLLDEMNEVLVA